MLVFANASNPSWAAILLAVLGSSAIGAIVGGYLTTRLRGRIEHDEAVRTRLIDAADAFVDGITSALLAHRTGYLTDAANGLRRLRGMNGELLEDVAESIKQSREYAVKTQSLVTRVELLYGSSQSEGSPYWHALNAIDCINGSLGLVEGKAVPQAAVRAAIAMVRGDWVEVQQLTESGATARRAEALQRIATDNQEFDPKDDASVAAWSSSLREASAEHLHAFVAGVQGAIRAPHPSLGGSPSVSRFGRVNRA
jgi:hypothetical protein